MVRQVRVVRNTSILGLLSLLVLWLARRDVASNVDVAFYGLAAGAAYAAMYWRALRKRIERRNRRYERNKIFVRFISVFDFMLAAAGAGLPVLIGMVAVVLAVTIFDFVTDNRWAVLCGGFGVSGAAVLTTLALRYERAHGPLYYQYDSRAWLGGEGMLYQVGVVEEPLTPTGLINLNGELWSATSKSGESIGKGEKVEVISRAGLLLYVDRVCEDRTPTERG